ncbi:MAG: hypothetical protein ACREVL_09255 [Solimonas sp.]
MTKASKISASDEAWESGALGGEESYVKLSPRSGHELDEPLDLQLISIRLPKAMIEDLKFIAEREGLKYQPLMRRVLTRFVNCEMKDIARRLAAAEDQREREVEHAAAAEERKRA